MTRLAYLGTPEMAVPPLRALVGAGHDVALVVTRPDRRRGRGGRATPSPVKDAAQELGIPATEDMDRLVQADVELAVVVAFGRIIPTRLLEQIPMVNVHFSLLPRWRGAAPVERAILAGDTETGVCLMKVDAGLDTGDVYAVRTVPMDEEITLAELRTRLVDVACTLLVDELAHGVAGLPAPKPQRGGPTLAEKITKEDLHLDWSQPAVQLNRVVRLGHAWTTFRGKRITVLEATVTSEDSARDGLPPGTILGTLVTTGSGSLELCRVQPESRSPMSADEWLRGVRPADGERLGTD
ncbi:MAG TPA: methionyl-tRNA formyltransferase [Acidimicrobiales bacterium]|nr:methionyl-tRNA formyltransferase [Acidimicrobiales bacterium]